MDDDAVAVHRKGDTVIAAPVGVEHVGDRRAAHLHHSHAADQTAAVVDGRREVQAGLAAGSADFHARDVIAAGNRRLVILAEAEIATDVIRLSRSQHIGFAVEDHDQLDIRIGGGEAVHLLAHLPARDVVGPGGEIDRLLAPGDVTERMSGIADELIEPPGRGRGELLQIARLGLAHAVQALAQVVIADHQHGHQCGKHQHRAETCSDRPRRRMPQFALPGALRNGTLLHLRHHPSPELFVRQRNLPRFQPPAAPNMRST